MMNAIPAMREWRLSFLRVSYDEIPTMDIATLPRGA
jgi:hypothetical protein